MPEVRLRQAARAVILDPAGRALLVRFEFPDRTVWACPGGGIEPGESDQQALRRELAEETGLLDPEIGPCIWVREHRFSFLSGQWDGQAERFYLVRGDAFDPRPRLSADELAREYVTAIRWWEPIELTANDALADGGIRFAPRRLPGLLEPLRRGEIPSRPIDAGI